MADFGTVSSWAGAIDHSCILSPGPGGGPVGTTRRIQMGRDTLVERIIDHDPPRTLAYDIDGLPKSMGRVTNRWTLQPAADGATLVSVTSTVDIGGRPDQRLAEHLFCRVVARTSAAMLTDLANRMERARV